MERNREGNEDRLGRDDREEENRRKGKKEKNRGEEDRILGGRKRRGEKE